MIEVGLQITNDSIKKINKFDLGWISINFGMGIGAGVVMVPVIVGVVGFPIFILSVLIAFPGIYLFQKLYISTLFVSKEPKIYSEIVSGILGPKWEIIIAVIYLLMMVIWTTIYAQIVSKVIALYMYQLEISSNPDLANNVFYSFMLVAVLIFLGFKSQKLLIKTVTLFSVILCVSVIVVTFALIPFWDVKNLTFIPEASTIIPKLIILIPFSLTSILFIQSLSPMVIGYKKEYNTDPIKARKKAVFGMAVAFAILSVIVLMFIVSFTLAIPHDMAIDGKDSDLSAFLLINKYGMSNIYLVIVGGAINIFAILTSFLSILAGMKNSLNGIMFAIIRKTNINATDIKIVDKISVLAIFLLAWSAIVFNPSIYKLVPLCGPIFGILGCLIPVYLVYKVPALHKLKTKSLYYILFVGIVLIISPLLSSSL